ncbi:MAG: M3 family oligoendopeptidase [Planctomycetota bacterium]
MREHSERRSPAADFAGTGSRASYVPDGLDASSIGALRPLLEELRDRSITTVGEAEEWLLDRSALFSAAHEARGELFIATTCRTDDERVQTAWRVYLDETAPELRTRSFELDRKLEELFGSFDLDASRYEVLKRSTSSDVRLFREENVSIVTALSKLDNDYDQLCGAMTVMFQGEERTLPQMGAYLQNTDRGVRESAWRAVADRRLADHEPIDAIFDQMVSKRHEMAQNAGFERFTEFNFESRHRFDYGVAESEAFHDAVEQVLVPFTSGLTKRRTNNLGLDTVRPWDLAVDEFGRPPLKPFKSGQDLIDRTRRVFDRLDPGLGELFSSLGDDMGGQFDLESRRGKASGGYQYMRDRSGTPFIFMNAAGLHRDVETMVHEAGHAFHSLLCWKDPLLEYRHAPIEFCEVASMVMELLTMPFWDEYYADPAEADRARRQQLEGTLSLFPWVATIDAFQHWVYANPSHTAEERRGAWHRIFTRFSPDVDWAGLEDAHAYQWQRQGHLFGSPFYYIEYGIAQLGALSLWLISLEEGPARALELYKHSLAIGGARPLPELFEAAGVPFDFSASRMATLREAVERELAKLPE